MPDVDVFAPRIRERAYDPNPGAKIFVTGFSVPWL